MLVSNYSKAQVSVNINIGSPPLWGPVGYTDVRYYYLPDVEAYYDIETSMFIYYGGGTWLHRANLPSHYSHYDLYSGYKVVMHDYHGNTPHHHFHDHKKKYAKGYRGKPQKTIGNKPEKGNSKAGGSPNKKSGQKTGNSSKQSGGTNKSSGSSKSGNSSKTTQKENSMGGGKKK